MRISLNERELSNVDWNVVYGLGRDTKSRRLLDLCDLESYFFVSFEVSCGYIESNF
jgi:hypothetical protein